MSVVKQNTGKRSFLNLTAFMFWVFMKAIFLSCCLAELNVELWT